MHETRQQPGSPAWERLIKVTLGLLLSVGLINWIYDHLPPLRPSGSGGIVSLVQLSGLDSRQNYLVFGACFGVATLLAWACAAWTPRFNRASPSATAPASRRMPASSLGLYASYWMTEWQERLSAWRVPRLKVHPVAAVSMLGVLFVSWLINVEFRDLAMPMTHKVAFHEGEFLGFGTTLAQLGKPFTSAFFIHGFGINAWPDLLAQQLGFRSNGIAAARMGRVLESSVAWFGLAWVIREIVRTVRERGGLAGSVTLLAVLLMSGLCYELTLRRSLSLPQLAALLWFVRTGAMGMPRTARTYLGAFALGCSMPLAFLYDYSEASWFVAISLASLPLVFLLEGRQCLRWLGATIAGALAASVGTGLALGPEELQAMVGQVLYWGHYGREIWFIPLTAKALHGSRTFAFLVVVPALVVAYLLVSWRRCPDVRAAARRYGVLAVLLVGSLIGDRVGLDRAIEEHLRWAAVNNTLLLVALAWSMVADLEAEWRGGPFRAVPSLMAGLVALGVFVHAAPSSAGDLSPWLALDHLRVYGTTFWTPDAAILTGPYQEARTALGAEVAKSRSFYCLTSDAIWYRVFQKPSASRFHQLTYARAPEGQQEVIRSLEAAQPDLILVSGYGSMNGISPEVGNPAVYRYVLEHYRPYRTVGHYSFWKRAAESPWSQVATVGIPGALTGYVRQSPLEGRVSGYVDLAVSTLGAQPPRLYLATRQGRKLVSQQELDPTLWDAAGKRLTFTVDVPWAPDTAKAEDLSAWLSFPDGRFVPVTGPVKP